MEALTLWKTVTVDEANLLERLIAALAEHEIRYCVVGGQAVNAYVEPLVSLDLDLALSAPDVARIGTLLMMSCVPWFERPPITSVSPGSRYTTVSAVR